MTTIPRESREFLPLTVTDTTSGTPVTAGIEYALTQGADRPTAWTPAEVRDGTAGVVTAGTLEPGRYTVWVRITTTTDSPVDMAGWFIIN